VAKRLAYLSPIVLREDVRRVLTLMTHGENLGITVCLWVLA
jgi:hypothetical protein